MQLLWVLRSGRYSCQSPEGTGFWEGLLGDRANTGFGRAEKETVDTHPLCNNEKGFWRFEGQPKVGLT